MDRAEQLAAFLAGDLDPGERAALRAELDRDPALRQRLLAMRTADRRLEGMSSPTPGAGFEARLDVALAPRLAEALRPGPADGDPAHRGTVHDELAARRDRRRRPLPRWATGLTAAAAAVIGLAGAGIVLSDVLGGGDDEAATDTADVQTMEADDGAGAAAESAPADGPLLIGGGRPVDEDLARRLLDDPTAFGLAERGLDPAAASSVSGPYALAFGDPAAAGDRDATTEAPAEDAGETADTDDAGRPGGDVAEESTDGDRDASLQDDAGDAGLRPAPLRIEGEITAADREAVSRCLATLLDGTPDIVPVYAELASFEDAPAILFGLVTEDPETGRFSRREVWIVDRSTCDVRLFVQGS